MNENQLDQALRKVAQQQPAPRLSSNFTYRTLERIRMEAARKEARREKRLFVLMLLTVCLMISGCIGVLIHLCGLAQLKESLTAWLPSLPSIENGKFYLPMLLALPLLALFNHWLRKKYRHLLP